MGGGANNIMWVLTFKKIYKMKINERNDRDEVACHVRLSSETIHSIHYRKIFAGILRLTSKNFWHLSRIPILNVAIYRVQTVGN